MNNDNTKQIKKGCVQVRAETMRRHSQLWLTPWWPQHTEASSESWFPSRIKMCLGNSPQYAAPSSSGCSLSSAWRLHPGRQPSSNPPFPSSPLYCSVKFLLGLKVLVSKMLTRSRGLEVGDKRIEVLYSCLLRLSEHSDIC